MQQCPNCHRFGVEHDLCSGVERCLWQDCGWRNIDNIDLDKIKHPIRFKKFIKSIKRKTSI